MSSGRTPAALRAKEQPSAEPVDGRRKRGPDIAILAGWIAGLLLLAGLLWALTLPVKNRIMVRAVNNVFLERGDSRRVGESSSAAASHFGMGVWFPLIDSSGGRSPSDENAFSANGVRVFVFSFYADGSFFPCAAIMTQEGKVGEFIPLNSHGERVIQRVSPGIQHIYAKRIEGMKP